MLEKWKLQQVGVEMDDVEFGRARADIVQHREMRRDIGLERRRIEAQRLLSCGNQLRTRDRIATGEQDHVVTKLDQGIAQIGHYPFGPAVELRWHGFTQWRNLRNTHSRSVAVTGDQSRCNPNRPPMADRSFAVGLSATRPFIRAPCRSGGSIVFSKDQFIHDCIEAIPDGQARIREIVLEAVSDSAGMMAELGPPQHAGLVPLFRSPELTIINFVWAPFMCLTPHNHQMFSVVGIYCGREDNVMWRRKPTTIEAAGAKSLGTGDVATLGRDVIHSVLNPIGKMTCAVHVYGGDFFNPGEPRSEWDHETLAERPWNMDRVRSVFREAEARFNATRTETGT